MSNGGFLDEVLWVANTHNEDDLKYMDKLVKSSTLYRNLTLIDLGYAQVWEHAVDDKNMFIKIDDDMVCLLSLVVLPCPSMLMNVRFISAIMLSPTLSTLRLSIQKPWTLLQIWLIVLKLAGYTIILGLFTPIFRR